VYAGAEGAEYEDPELPEYEDPEFPDDGETGVAAPAEPLEEVLGEAEWPGSAWLR